MTGTLFLVGTPIGNLGDLSDRARLTLTSVDVIAAEDTRRTGRLIASFVPERPPMVSYFEGNEVERTQQLVRRMQGGEDVALVTDGGMPAISDPGFRLVTACIDAGVPVQVIPGPSSALAALVVSGLPTDRFAFEGFLPRRSAERVRRLRTLRDDERTLILFESPKRMSGLLADIVEVLGDRRVALVRELTKLHEEVRRGTASDVAAAIEASTMKGEVVLVVEGRTGAAPVDLDACVKEATALVDSGMKKREAARVVGERRGVAPNQIYRQLVRR